MAYSQEVDLPGPYHWQNRILVVFADEQGNTIEQQITHLQEHKAGMDERDMRVFQIFKDKIITPNQTVYAEKNVNKLRKQFDVNQEGFTVILVGKDGGEKLRQHEILSVEKLFATIDAMPMRRQEMKNKRSKTKGY